MTAPNRRRPMPSPCVQLARLAATTVLTLVLALALFAVCGGAGLIHNAATAVLGGAQ